MTDRYISLVAVRHDMPNDKNFLFEAPSGCCLRKGELVLVDSQFGESIGRVVAVQNYVLVGDTEYEFAVNSLGATEPLKRVIGVFKPYKYEEDNNG